MMSRMYSSMNFVSIFVCTFLSSSAHVNRMMCPVCGVKIEKKIALFPNGGDIIDYGASGLKQLNALLFNANADVDMNATLEKIAVGQNAVLVDNFKTLYANMLLYGREFDAMDKDNELKELELQSWKNEAKMLESNIAKLKKQKKKMVKTKRMKRDSLNSK